MTGRPERSEAALYYFTYIDQVPDGNILDLVDAQAAQAEEFFRGISGPDSLRRYAPGKWNIREVVGHLIDTERLFVFRAFWFARGFDTPLPSFDQLIAVATAGAAERPWDSLTDEFGAVRAASSRFYRSLPTEAWDRRGIASENPFTVRALAWLTVGHVIHHLEILRTRYLVA